MPELSVIIPNYNYSKYLKERIDSVINQTFREIEIIIIDDCSSDNSIEIIREFAKNDNRIKVFVNEKNSGSPFFQWKKGVNLANSEYIWIAESDDFANEQFIEKLLPVIQSNSKLGLVYCQSYKADADSNITDSWKTWTDSFGVDFFDIDFITNGVNFIQHYLIHKNVIPNASGVIFRKSAYQKVKGVDTTIKNCSDWLLWLKVLMHYDLAFISEPLNYFRFHSESVIASAGKNIDKSTYYETFDKSMRLKFEKFLKDNFNNQKEILEKNSKYIFHDIGNEGIFYAKQKKYLKAIVPVIRATFIPQFNLGFIKRYISTFK